MDWKRATIEDVRAIVERELAGCSLSQLNLFEKYRVQPHVAPIMRSGSLESVVVVAQRGNEVIYWEDVEEGFEISPVDSNGQILVPGSNQNDLRLAIDAWAQST
jgi:hypothetical protein